VSEFPPAGAPQDPNRAEGGIPEGGEPKRRRGLITLIIILAAVVLALIITVVWLVASNAASPSPTPTPTTSTASASPTQTPTPTKTTTPAVARCTVDQLNVTLGQGSGAAGSVTMPILFTNKGKTPCELHGFPGVSFVGDNKGTQRGAPADEDSATAIQPNTLQPGGGVQAGLKIEQAANFDKCTVVPADGFRVYPPHSFDAVFVPAKGLSACSNADVHLLTVKPVLPQ
jgi:cytoskeletal protein RodZ